MKKLWLKIFALTPENVALWSNSLEGLVGTIAASQLIMNRPILAFWLMAVGAFFNKLSGIIQKQLSKKDDSAPS